MWYRVTDRAHPLWGLEVCGENCIGAMDHLIHVESVRRFDVFVGDRPMQISRVRGMYLSCDILEESPYQGDVQAELGSPYGKCLDEWTSKIYYDSSTLGGHRPAGTVSFVVYERAATVAVSSPTDQLLAADTVWGARRSEDIREAVESYEFPDLVDAVTDGSFWDFKKEKVGV